MGLKLIKGGRDPGKGGEDHNSPVSLPKQLVIEFGEHLIGPDGHPVDLSVEENWRDLDGVPIEPAPEDHEWVEFAVIASADDLEANAFCFRWANEPGDVSFGSCVAIMEKMVELYNKSQEKP